MDGRVAECRLNGVRQRPLVASTRLPRRLDGLDGSGVGRKTFLPTECKDQCPRSDLGDSRRANVTSSLNLTSSGLIQRIAFLFCI